MGLKCVKAQTCQTFGVMISRISLESHSVALESHMILSASDLLKCAFIKDGHHPVDLSEAVPGFSWLLTPIAPQQAGSCCEWGVAALEVGTNLLALLVTVG